MTRSARMASSATCTSRPQMRTGRFHEALPGQAQVADGAAASPSGSRWIKNGDELTLVDALEQAGRPGDDAGEPSWGVLAHLAREARFVHVWRRLHFMAHKWAVPVGEYFDDVQPFVAKHRYLRFLREHRTASAAGWPCAAPRSPTAWI